MPDGNLIIIKKKRACNPIIGASLSEPHMGSKSVPRELSIYLSIYLCIYVSMYAYVFP